MKVWRRQSNEKKPNGLSPAQPDAARIRFFANIVNELLPFIESLVMSFEELADRNGICLEFLAKRKSVRGRIDTAVVTTIMFPAQQALIFEPFLLPEEIHYRSTKRASVLDARRAGRSPENRPEPIRVNPILSAN